MTQERMGDLFEEARFRGMGGGDAGAAARARMDAERAAKRRAGYTWREEPESEQRGAVGLYNKYSDKMAEVFWYTDDEGPHPFRLTVMVPGHRGQVREVGRGFASVEKAKEAALRELEP